MRFLDPWFLVLILPVLAFILWRGRKTGTRYAYSITAFVAGFRARWVMRLLQVLLAVVLLGLIASMARPVTDGGIVPTVTRSRDTIILIDKSGSMDLPYLRSSEAGTQGMPPFGIKTGAPSQEPAKQEPTKYDLSRDLAAKFIESRPDDRLTACVFFDYYFYGYYKYRIVCPAPLDKDDHDMIIRWLRIPDKAEGGTPLGQAMISALNHLDEMGQSGERILILLSDGDGAWSAEMEAVIAKLFAKTNAKLYWVFIEDVSTIEGLLKGENPWSESQLGLMRLVNATNGRRFIADSPEHLAEALEAVKQLSTEPVIVRLPAGQRDLYPLVLTASIALFILTFTGMRVWIR